MMPTKMVIPMALFMLPALFVVIFGGIVAQYMTRPRNDAVLGEVRLRLSAFAMRGHFSLRVSPNTRLGAVGRVIEICPIVREPSAHNDRSRSSLVTGWIGASYAARGSRTLTRSD